MKVEKINSYKAQVSFKKANYTIEQLSGIDTLNKYKERIEKNNSRKLQNELDLNNVLYNSLFVFAQEGLYKSAGIFFDELRNKMNIEKDYELSNLMGSVNKALEDYETSNLLYKNSYNTAPDDDFFIKLDSLKNFQESSLVLNKKEELFDISSLAYENEPYQNMVYLYLKYLSGTLKNKETSNAAIKAAYTVMQSKGLRDKDIILNMCIALSEEGNYEKSNEILTENLDFLENSGKIYTKDFADYLLLYGLNEFENAQNNNFERSTAVFQNVSKIAEAINLPFLKEIADYSIVKNLFLSKNEDFPLFAQEFLTYAKNNEYKSNLNEMLGDFYRKDAPEKSAKFFEAAKKLLTPDEKTKERILRICQKLKAVKPQDREKIDKEIKDLKVENHLDSHSLIEYMIKDYEGFNYERLNEACRRVIEKSKDKTNKKLASVYLNLTGIKQGADFQSSMKKVDFALNDIKEIYAQKSNDKTLSKFLFSAYRDKAEIFYLASEYSQAARAQNEADKYFSKIQNNEDIMAKHKIRTALINYKAKRYYDAEKYTLEYLGLLLNKKDISHNPMKITEEVKEILSSKNDTEQRKIAAVYETLGLINLKNKNFKDAQEYFLSAVDIRERLVDKDFQLANSYAALARIAIINSKLFKSKKLFSSKDLHNKALHILKEKYPNDVITKEEIEFHKKYYGKSFASAGKYIRNLWSDKEKIIEKFKCYNKELNICE